MDSLSVKGKRMASAIDKTFLGIVYLGMLVKFTANE